MSKATFLTFQRFRTLAEAEALIATFEAEGIAYQLEDHSPNVDITFSANHLQDEIRIKIQQKDFERAHQILEEQAQAVIENYPEDHYLYAFSDTELLEIIEKPDEWSKEDYLFAQKLIEDRGIDFSEEEIIAAKEERQATLRTPKPANRPLVILFYLLALIGSPLGIFLGWYYSGLMKTDEKGERYYVFTDTARKQGRKLLWFNIIVYIVWIVLFNSMSWE